MEDLEAFRRSKTSVRPSQKESLTYVIYNGRKYYIDISKLQTERPSQHAQNRSSIVSSDSNGSEDSNGYLIMHRPLTEQILEAKYHDVLVNERFQQNSSPMTTISEIELESIDSPQVVQKNESPRNSARKGFCHCCCNLIFWTVILMTPLTVAAVLIMYCLFNNNDNSI